LGFDALGDLEAVASLDPLTAAAQIHTDIKVASLIPLPLAAAMTAAAVRDWARAERHFDEARELFASAEIRMFKGCLLEAEADMRRRRGAAGDAECAAALYDRAAAEYADRNVELFARRLAEKRARCAD